MIPIKQVRELIKEFSRHDLEAFETRTELLKVMMEMCDEIENLRAVKKGIVE